MSKTFNFIHPATHILWVEKNQKKFGEKYIVLPNTSYGDWENAIYGETQLSLEERKALILKILKDKPHQ